MESVFTYTDYRLFLKDYIHEKKLQNKGFSFKVIADRAGFKARDYILRVMNGSRNLSQSGVCMLSQAIRFSEKEAEYFTNLVGFNQAKKPSEKDFFFNKFSIELSQIKADIASIKQHQARHAVTSEVIQVLKNESMALKAEVERLRGVTEMKTKIEITPSPPSLNKQISNEFEAKRELFPSTSQHNAGASSEGSISEQILNLSNKESQNFSTPVDRKWADICKSSIGSPKTQG